MPNDIPKKNMQSPNKYVPIPEGALKEKYKTQAEKYNNKEIPGDQTDLTGKELMLININQISRVSRAINKDEFVPKIEPPFQNQNYAILDAQNNYHNVEEMQKIYRALYGEDNTHPVIDIVAFKPARVLAHTMVVELSVSVQISDTIATLDESLKSKYDFMMSQIKKDDFIKKCNEYRTEVEKEINNKLDKQSASDSNLSSNEKIQIDEILKSDDIKIISDKQIRSWVALDRLTNQYFEAEAKNLIKESLDQKIADDRSSIKNKYGYEPQEYLHKKSALEIDLKNSDKLIDYLNAEVQIEEKYTLRDDQLKQKKQLLQDYLQDKASKHEGFFDYYIDRKNIIENYFIPLTERELNQRNTLAVNGGIASGKGSSVGLIEYNYEYAALENSRDPADTIKINGDSYKVLLNPTYLEKDLKTIKSFSQLVQPEIGLIGEQILNEIKSKQKNGKASDVIIDKVILPDAWIEVAISGNGKLSGIIVSTSESTAISRAYARGNEVKRFESSEGILGTHQGVAKRLHEIISKYKNKNIKYSIMDNNVQKGEDPQNVATLDLKTNRIEVYDKPLLERFLQKALIDIGKTLEDTQATENKIEYMSNQKVDQIYSDFIENFANKDHVNKVWDITSEILQKNDVRIAQKLKDIVERKIAEQKSSLEKKSKITLIKEMQDYLEQIQSVDGLKNIKQNKQFQGDVQRHIRDTAYKSIKDTVDAMTEEAQREFVTESININPKSIIEFLSTKIEGRMEESIKTFVREYLNTRNPNFESTEVTAEFIKNSQELNTNNLELAEALISYNKNGNLLTQFIKYDLTQEVTGYTWDQLMKITINPQESSYLSSSVQEVIREYLSQSNDISITSIQQIPQSDIQNLIEQRKADIEYEIRAKQQKLEQIRNENTQLQHDKKQQSILEQAKLSLERELEKLKVEQTKILDHDRYIGDIKEHERKITEHLDHNVLEDHIREHEVHEHMRGEHKGRIKRFMQDIDVEESDNVIYIQNQNNTHNISFDDTTKSHTFFVSNSASSVASPINTAINWLSSSFAQLKFLSSVNIITNYGFIKDGIQNIQSIFAKSECIDSENIKDNTVTAINVEQFDINASLTLANFIIRCFTKVKPYNPKEESIDLLGVKAYVLNITTEFEEILNDPYIQNYLPVETLKFDPIVLMSKLEKAVINGNYTEIEKILHRSIVNNNYHLDDTQFSSDIQDKINEMLAQQNAEYSYNQQLISDYSSNNHTTAEDMSNILGIENDINYINHQSEVNLIG